MIGLDKKGKEKQNMLTTTLSILKQNKKIFLTSAALLIFTYSFLYGLWKIPVINFGINRQSAVGIADYAFVILVSILTAAFLALFLHEKKSKLSSTNTAAGFGAGFAGFASAVCPVCQSVGLVAFGTTLLNVPTSFLTPYLSFLKIVSIGVLGLAVYLKADSIHTKKCRTCKVKITTRPKKKEPFLLRSNLAFAAIVGLVLLVGINNMLIPKAFAASQFSGTWQAASLGAFEYGPKTTLKPMPLSHGEQPAIDGYKSKVKPLPTISELEMKPLTGDAAQDVLNNIVPTGTPWYGPQAGVSFDDPITAQNLWAKGRTIQLSPEEEQRWNRIANSFTCDYCCGSPQNPTILTRCGCAHSAAAQGMAKWFVKNYGSSYSDEEIYGEMARWYALWYPGPTIKRILLEAQAT